MKLHLGLIFAVVLGGCVTGPAPITPPPDATDAMPRPSCHAACSELAAMACPEGRPTPAGRSCEDVCGAVASFEGAEDFKRQLVCIARANTLDAMHTCGVKCGMP